MTNKPGPKTVEGKNKVTKNLPDPSERVWNYSEKGKKAMSKAARMGKLKHGLYASIPILCKVDECPYSDACYIGVDDRPKGEPCPVEASTIEQMVNDYCESLDVSKDDAVELSMVRALVDAEISILRCNKKLAVDPDVVKREVITVTEDDRPITRPEISKAYDLQGRLVRQKNEILRELNATPKAKADTDANSNQDASSIVATMKKNLQKMKDEGGSDEITVEVVQEQ